MRRSAPGISRLGILPRSFLAAFLSVFLGISVLLPLNGGVAWADPTALYRDTAVAAERFLQQLHADPAGLRLLESTTSLTHLPHQREVLAQWDRWVSYCESLRERRGTCLAARLLEWDRYDLSPEVRVYG